MKKSKRIAAIVLSTIMLLGATFTVHAGAGACGTCERPLEKTNVYIGPCNYPGCSAPMYKYVCPLYGGEFYHTAHASICDAGHCFY